MNYTNSAVPIEKQGQTHLKCTRTEAPLFIHNAMSEWTLNDRQCQHSKKTGFFAITFERNTNRNHDIIAEKTLSSASGRADSQVTNTYTDTHTHTHGKTTVSSRCACTPCLNTYTCMYTGANILSDHLSKKAGCVHACVCVCIIMCIM